MNDLTIGIPVYDDFDGIFFTVQSLRLYHDLDGVEILVVDNSPDSAHGKATAKFCATTGVCYHPYDEKRGSAPAKQEIFAQAAGEWVLCLDSHVLLAPGSLDAFRAYVRAHSESTDLVHGVLLHDDLEKISTHWKIEEDGEPLWSDGILGQWATDERGRDPHGPPFEVEVSGMGCFASRREDFPGFPPSFHGFGAEEVYVHERIRQRGDRCLCLPPLRWIHRFVRPGGTPYPNAVHERFANYLVGHRVNGRDETALIKHYREFLPDDLIESIIRIVDEVEAS